MRLLILENELTSTRGGQELSLRDVTRGLADRGHHITLAYVTGGDLESEYRQVCDRLVRVRTYSIDRSRTAGALRDFMRSLWAVRGTRPDIVYANQYLDSLFGRAMHVVHQAPLVCHLRLPPPDRMCGQFRIGMRGVARMIAISEQTKREWVGHGYEADAIDVVYNGIDLGTYARRGDRDGVRASLGIPADALLVTYAGRLHPAKGLETLLRAFAIVARQRRSWLVVAGRGAILSNAEGGSRDYVGELHEVAGRLGIQSAITWIEHYGDMAALFNATDISTLPSIWSEPFGRVVIESMACETPVVASRVGGIAEILTGEFADWMVEPGNADQLAGRLLAVAEQSVADRSIRRRARVHVASRFSANRMVDGIERVLIETAERRRMVSAPAPTPLVRR